MAIGSGELSGRNAVMVVVAFVFLALAGAYYMFPHTTRAAELDELEARIEQLDRINARAAADVASGNVQQLKDEAEEHALALGVLRQLVPQTNEVPTLLEQISTAARREGLEVGGIRPEPTIVGPEFDTHRFHLSVSGGYHSVARFLANVGSLSRIVTPVNVVMSEKLLVAGATTAVQSGPNTGSVAAEFEIRTYVARAAAAAAGGN